MTTYVSKTICFPVIIADSLCYCHHSPDINEDLHAAEVMKYTVSKCILICIGMFIRIYLQSVNNIVLSNNCTQTHESFSLYDQIKTAIFWAWNISLFECLKFDLTTNQNMNKNK